MNMKTEIDTSQEIAGVIDAVVQTISLEKLDLTDEFFPAHLSVAVIDAVFRARRRHAEAAVPAAERYCRRFGLRRTRDDRWNRPPASEQETLQDLVRRYDELGEDAIAADVFEMRRSVPERQVAKVATVLRIADALRRVGVDTLQDMSERSCAQITDTLRCLPGVCEYTVRRLLMYTGGDDFVLGDAYVQRFVASAVVRDSVTSDAAETLVRSAAYELILSPRFLDREIWLYGLSR